MSKISVTLDVSAVPEQPAGAGRYIVELARHLALHNAAHDDVALHVITRRNDAHRWQQLVPNGPVHVHALAPSWRPLRLAWEQVGLPGALRRLQPDVHHGPHYTFPRYANVPSVVTIHDMTFFDHPEWHERAKVLLFTRSIESAVHRATRLVAVSQDTARRLHARFGAALCVDVIPHGVDHERFAPAGSPAEEAADQKLLAQHGIEGRYIAFVGTLEPRKDVPTLLAAFDRLAAAPENSDLRLILAGRPGWGAAAVTRAISAMTHANRVVRTGFLPDAAIPALLRQATAVAYPSLLEGFGLPALEALACGAALVTTTGSANEEVVEDAALLVKPGDVVGLTEALSSLVQDDSLRLRLALAGPSIASRYTWEASAAAHLEAYRAAVESKR